MKPFWHIHHEVLLEWSDDIQERIDYIKAHKPPHEVVSALGLLKPFQGALPPKLVKAKAAYDKARDAFVKASVAYAKARDAYDKARDAFVKASVAYAPPREAYDTARDAYNKAYDECLPQIEALHALECPDCPWNGTTIFPETTLE